MTKAALIGLYLICLPAIISHWSNRPGPQEKAAVLIEKHFGMADEGLRQSMSSRVLSAIKPFTVRPNGTDEALDMSERLIRSVIGDLEFNERALALSARPLSTATRELPRVLFLESYELSVQLVEAIMSEEVDSRATTQVEADLLRRQISEITEHWRAATSTVLLGKHGRELAGYLAERKKEELEQDIGQPFVGLRIPLDNNQVAAVKKYIWDEVASTTDRPAIDDVHVLELYRANDPISIMKIYEILSPEQREAIDKLRSLTNRLGNAVHVVWNFSHPRAAPLLEAQAALRRRVQAYVTGIQEKEGVDSDPAYQHPHLAHRPLQTQPIDFSTKPKGSSSIRADSASKPDRGSEKTDRKSSSQNAPPQNTAAYIVSALVVTVIVLLVWWTLRSHPRKASQ